jgi:flagellar motility protein MotE (MotC chaperone)
MIRFARDFRLIPVVLVATISLFALKVSGIVFDGGYTLSERLQNRNKPGMRVTTADSVPEYPKIVVADQQTMPAGAAPASRTPWATEMFNFGDGPDVTGAIGSDEDSKEPALKASKTPPPETPKLKAGDEAMDIKPGHIISPGERAILTSLQDRREKLDARERRLDMRETLLKAAEKRLEAKVTELKDMEQRIKTAIDNRDKEEAERFQGIVSMYENMKAKDAARIFDRLDLGILVDVSTQMNPRKMSEILAQMNSEAAERLTIELAKRASGNKAASPDELPKIAGKPTGQ